MNILSPEDISLYFSILRTQMYIYFYMIATTTKITIIFLESF